MQIFRRCTTKSLTASIHTTSQSMMVVSSCCGYLLSLRSSGIFQLDCTVIRGGHSVLIASEGRSKNKADILPHCLRLPISLTAAEMSSCTTDLLRSAHPTRAPLSCGAHPLPPPPLMVQRFTTSFVLLSAVGPQLCTWDRFGLFAHAVIRLVMFRLKKVSKLH